MNKILLLSAALFLLTQNCSAQKQIKLTKRHRVRIIKEGDRIAYAIVGDSVFSKRVIKTIDKDFFIVNDKSVAYGDLIAIGRNTKGNHAFTYISVAIGAVLIVNSQSPSSDPCPTCQQVGSDSNDKGG